MREEARKGKAAASLAAKGYRRVLLAGATGLVGMQILQLLLCDDSVGELHVLSRRTLPIQHPKLRPRIVNFRHLTVPAPVDEVYLALGTTMRVAGSREAFYAVDFEANLAVAKMGLAAGARRIALVSAVGADARSSVFYSRTKGELEEALGEMNPAALVIARPSLLLGDRDALKQPQRLAEKIAIRIATSITPMLPRSYRPVHALDVARSLVKTLPTVWDTIVLHSDDLIRLGASTRAGK